MLDIGDATRRWQLGDTEQIADTPGSLVYRALAPGGQSVIVKLLKPHGMGELSGMDYLAWRAGHGAIRLLARDGNACLLEDAGQRDLEQLRQAEGEAAATRIFADVVSRLHAPSEDAAPAGLVPLRRHFSALLEAGVTMPAEHGANVVWAAELARALLDGANNAMPLHGDLHHENILADADGTWCAIDPHGLIGDPVYDLANFFGNPLGKPEITCDRNRIGLLARELSAATGYDGSRILRFAAAHAGLSACWSIGDPVSDDDLADAGDRLAFLATVRDMLTSDR